MKYNSGEDIKIGDKIRVVMISYPTPNEFFLGKVSTITINNLLEEINCVKLDNWGLNVNIGFIEKVSDDAIDIEMELNESNIFNPFNLPINIENDIKTIIIPGLISEIKRDCRWKSDPNIILDNPNFKKLSKYGKKSIPFMIRELDNRTVMFWIVALSEIVGYDVSSDSIEALDRITDWKKWAVKNEFITNDELLIREMIREAEHTNSPDPEEIAKREEYRKVITLGKKVIPYLLERKKYIWSIGLKELTGYNPPDSAVGSTDIVECWRKWGSKNGYEK